MASANWRCADCDTFNGPAEAACTVCGEARRDPGPSTVPTAGKTSGPAAKKPDAARPPAKRPGSTARPAADWRCADCDTYNARTDLSCLTCGTSWKAAAKKTAPKSPKSPKSSKPSPSGDAAAKKTTPRKPAAKKTTPRTGAGSASSTSRPRPASARPGTSGSSARRTGGASGGTRPRTEEAVFFPSSPTGGYRPTAPHSTTVPPPPPAPVYTPPSRPSKDTGCLKGCFGVVVLLILLSVFAKGCDGAFDSDGSSDSDGTNGTTVAESCPSRIADELPDGEGAELVEAFRTSNKQITLCRTTSGSLYYYGEFSDRREKGIAMEAERTSDGYEARNGPYRYDIHDGVVTIYQSGRQIGEEDLTPEPSPS